MMSSRVNELGSGHSKELWKPRTLRNVSDRDFELNRTHFKAYGLGWRLADVHGYKEVAHTGTLAGMKSYVVLMPELELGVVLLTNGSSSAARTAVMNTVVRSFMPVEEMDWIKFIADEAEAEQQEQKLKVIEQRLTDTASQDCCVPELTQFTGRYRDPWFGDVTIRLEDEQLVFSADKSPKLTGGMSHHDGSRFVVRWTDRTLEADAYVLFERGENDRVVGISMTKLDNGDYDFEDLDFSRVE